ncbi:MAG: hypothetical protein ACI4DS_02485 [Eubacterium sp.]
MKKILDNKLKNKYKEPVAAILLVLVMGLLFRLKLPALLVVLGAILSMVPMLVKQKKKENDEMKRFQDVITYMEQVIYSFKKQPKIRETLIDARKVTEGKMKNTIGDAIEVIDAGEASNIYKEALAIIENQYSCSRIHSLHKFLVKIEKQGGNYENFINVLLDDIKSWNERTYLFQKDVNRVKRNVLISSVSTLITCAFMLFLIPEGYSYVDSIVYQIVTSVTLILLFAIHVGVNIKMNVDWLYEEEGINNNMAARYFEIVTKFEESPSYMSIMDRIMYKSAKKRLEKEISKAFPDWLRDTALNLQTETVQSSIEASYSEAAYVLKPPIKQLLLDFEENPIGIEPYDNFLHQFDLPEIKSSMKMFYCMNELGKDEADMQINSIIDRNNKLTDKAETMKNNDRIGGASFLSALPMLIGVVKIMTDMVLMILVFSSAISNVMTNPPA